MFVAGVMSLAACGGGSDGFDTQAARDAIATADPDVSASDREELVNAMRVACEGDVEGATRWAMDEQPAWVLDAFTSACPAAADVLDG